MFVSGLLALRAMLLSCGLHLEVDLLSLLCASLLVIVPVVIAQVLIPHLLLRLIKTRVIFHHALPPAHSSSDEDDAEARHTTTLQREWLQRTQPWLLLQEHCAARYTMTIAMDAARTLRWSWSLRKALREFRLTLYEPSVRITFMLNSGDGPNEASRSLGCLWSRWKIWVSKQIAPAIDGLLLYLTPHVFGFLQWLRVHIILSNTTVRVSSPSCNLRVSLARLLIDSSCSDMAEKSRVWKLNAALHDFQVAFSSHNSDHSKLPHDDIVLLSSSSEPIELRVSTPLSIRHDVQLMLKGVLPSAKDLCVELVCRGLKSRIFTQDLSAAASLLLLTKLAVKTKRSPIPKPIISTSKANMPQRIDVKLFNFDIALLSEPADVSGHASKCLNFAFSTFETFYERVRISSTFSSVSSLPLRFTLLTSEFVVGACSFSSQQTALDSKTELACSNLVANEHFTIVELNNLGLEAHIFPDLLFSPASPSAVSSQLVDDSNTFELSISSTALRIHPVIVWWYNTYPAFWSLSLNTFSHSKRSPSAAFSRPIFSLSEPVTAPTVSLRLLVDAEQVTVSVHRSDDVPMFISLLSTVKLSVFSTRDHTYDFAAMLGSVQLRCSSAGSCAFSDIEVLDLVDFHLPFVISNGRHLNSLNSSGIVDYLDLQVQPRIHCIALQISPTLLDSMRIIVEEYKTLEHLCGQVHRDHTIHSTAHIQHLGSYLPLIVCLSLSVNSSRAVLLSSTVENSTHALDLSSGRMVLRHQFEWKYPTKLLTQRPPSECLVSYVNAKICTPYAYTGTGGSQPFFHSMSIADELRLKLSCGEHDCLSMGRITVTTLARSSSTPLDTLAVKIDNFGASWSLAVQMTWFHIKQSFCESFRHLCNLGFMQRLTTGSTSIFSRLSGFDSGNSKLLIILVHVTHVALEFNFIEHVVANSTIDAHTFQASSDSPAQPVAKTSSMVFYSTKAKWSSPSSHILPKLPWHPVCPHVLPVTCERGWWAVDGVAILHWKKVFVGGGLGSTGLPDIACEIHRGMFRLPQGFNFGSSVQNMIDRWKAFRYWRKLQRELYAVRSGFAVEPEEEKHRAISAIYPYATDFDLGHIFLRLHDCCFELSDNIAAVDALSSRRQHLNADELSAEVELKRVGNWRSSSVIDLSRGKYTQSPSGIGLTGQSRIDYGVPPSSNPSQSLINRSLPHDASGTSDLIDVSNANKLVRLIMQRAHGTLCLAFPPVSFFPVTAPLFSVTAPHISMNVEYTTDLLSMGYLYRSVRSLDPCAHPPYEGFIRSEETNSSLPDPCNGFSDLWGRAIAIHGEQVTLQCRDFPLPLVRAKSVNLAGTLIFGQLKAPQRWLKEYYTMLAPFPPVSVRLWRGCVIPTKLYYDMQWDASELDVAYGPCMSPCFTAMAESINRLTLPAIKRVGNPLSWWDDLRYKVHGRLIISTQNTINVRILKTPSPYQRNFLLMCASTAQLYHGNCVFDGHGEDVVWEVICDEHLPAFNDEHYLKPDYTQGRLIYSPRLHVRVELEWGVLHLNDGSNVHMFDHYIHHYSYTDPSRDVMDHYRSRSLRYKCVKVKIEPAEKTKAEITYPSTVADGVETVDSGPLLPQGTPLFQHSTSLSSLAPLNPSSSSVPHLSCRFPAYHYFWRLVAIFQDPPLHLSPLANRTFPGLGELFQHLSLSVLMIEPRLEVLCESMHKDDAIVSGLLVQAARIGIDWCWMAEYKKNGVKYYVSQEMAVDAHRVSVRALSRNVGHSNSTTRVAAESVETCDVSNEERDRKAATIQMNRRSQGEVVNFVNSHGILCSPFDYPPTNFYVINILTTRLFAYRTYYSQQASSFSTAPNETRSQRNTMRLTQLEASSDPSCTERPPFCMDIDIQMDDGPEWQSLFASELGVNNCDDAVSDLWKGQPTDDDHAVDKSMEGSHHPSDNDEIEGLLMTDSDDRMHRMHKISFSEMNELVNDPPDVFSTWSSSHADWSKMLAEPQHNTLASSSHRSRLHHRRVKSDSHMSSSVNLDSVRTGSKRSIAGLSHEPFRHPGHVLHMNGDNIGVGATRDRLQPTIRLLDLSSCSHKFVCANVKLLVTESMKYAWLDWKEIFSRPYTPPSFVAAAQSATMQFRDAMLNTDKTLPVLHQNTSTLVIRPEQILVSLNNEVTPADGSSDSKPSHSLRDSTFLYDSIGISASNEHLQNEMMELVYEVDPNTRMEKKSTNSVVNNITRTITVTCEPSIRQSQAHRWSELSNWLSLYSVDFIRPQITFQSAETNSRFVLVAARASLESQGLPIALKRDHSSQPITLLPSADFHLESFLYFARKHVATLTDAQAFVCPVDIDGDGGRVQWVKDTVVMKRSGFSAGGNSTRSSAGQGSDQDNESVDTASPFKPRQLDSELMHWGVLRKIVEPCTLHFTMTSHCDIDQDLKARGLSLCDEQNGLAVLQTAKASRSRSRASRHVNAGAVVRTLNETIQLFIPSFHAHVDSNEYFTLQSVVQDLFLNVDFWDKLRDHSMAPIPLPADKNAAAALIERALHKDETDEESGQHKPHKQVRRRFQYALGRSSWELRTSTNTPFIAAHINSLYGSHTFFHDHSSDSEFSVHYLTLHSKLLSPLDPRANLLIPDPDAWLKRDAKRDQMVYVRAKAHAPLSDPSVSHITVYELFEVTIFPQVINGSYDDYLALKAYFFHDLTTRDESVHNSKDVAANNFFRFPRSKIQAHKTSTMQAASSSKMTQQKTDPNAFSWQSDHHNEKRSKRGLFINNNVDAISPSDIKRPRHETTRSALHSKSHTHDAKHGSPILHLNKKTSNKSLAQLKREPAQHYFRYLRVNGVTFLASFRRPGSIWNCENVSVTIAPLIKNQRCWSWEKFYSKMEVHLAWSFAHQIPQIVARLIGVKGEKSKEVEWLSQRFIDAQIQQHAQQRIQEVDTFTKPFDDERKLLGLPVAIRDTSVDSQNSSSAASPPEVGTSTRTFFRMRSMPSLHVPSLSIDMEELASKAILLFGSKKEKNLVERKAKKKDLDRRREEESRARAQGQVVNPSQVYWHGVPSTASQQVAYGSTSSNTNIIGVPFRLAPLTLTTADFHPSVSSPQQRTSGVSSTNPAPTPPARPARPPFHFRARSVNDHKLSHELRCNAGMESSPPLISSPLATVPENQPRASISDSAMLAMLKRPSRVPERPVDSPTSSSPFHTHPLPSPSSSPVSSKSPTSVHHPSMTHISSQQETPNNSVPSSMYTFQSTSSLTQNHVLEDKKKSSQHQRAHSIM